MQARTGLHVPTANATLDMSQVLVTTGSLHKSMLGADKPVTECGVVRKQVHDSGLAQLTANLSGRTGPAAPPPGLCDVISPLPLCLANFGHSAVPSSSLFCTKGGFTNPWR